MKKKLLFLAIFTAFVVAPISALPQPEDRVRFVHTDDEHPITPPTTHPSHSARPRCKDIAAAFPLGETAEQMGLLSCARYTDEWAGREFRDCEPNSILRHLASTRDPLRMLAVAAKHYSLAADSASAADRERELATANWIADMAVTGRHAYGRFIESGGIQESDVVAEAVRALNSGESDYVVDVDSVRQSLDRAYMTAWAIRGPRTIIQSPFSNLREQLGYIGSSPMDDPPHRPVNVPRSPYPQQNITVNVPTPYNSSSKSIEVDTRYILAGDGVEEPSQVFNPRKPPRDQFVGIPQGYDLVVFIHGHSSSADEVLSLVEPLVEESRGFGRKLAVVAMDMPSNAYSQMLEHTDIAPSDASFFNTGYPLLEFYEEFILQFVEELDQRQRVAERRTGVPEEGVKKKIIGVIGGSLGGNMVLRLSRRPSTTANAWLKRNMVAWSPASVWGKSWYRHVTGDEHDIIKKKGWEKTRERMVQEEFPGARSYYFGLVYGCAELQEEGLLGTFARIFSGACSQSEHWLPDGYQCKNELLNAGMQSRRDYYNREFRRWHWRVAHEQLIFMHGEPTPQSERDKYPNLSGYELFNGHLLLAAGSQDDAVPSKIYSHTVELSEGLSGGTKVTGTSLWVNAGHSIHQEHPEFFANQIYSFFVNNKWRNRPIANKAGGDPHGYPISSSQHLFYRDTAGGMHELLWTPEQGWMDNPLPASAKVAGDPFGYVVGGGQHVFYRDTAGGMHELLWLPNHGWMDNPLPASAKVAGDPFGYVVGGSQHVFYRDTAGGMHELLWLPNHGWMDNPLPASAKVAGDPFGYVVGGSQHVFYRDTAGGMHELLWLPNHGWMDNPLPASAKVAGDPFGYVVGGSQHVFYRDTAGGMHELLWTPEQGWIDNSLPASAKVAGDPFGYVVGGSQHVFYRDTAGGMHELLWTPEQGWIDNSLPTTAKAAGDPIGFMIGSSQHVFYRDDNNRISELEWK